MKKVISINGNGIFTGTHFLQARRLTKNDFTFECFTDKISTQNKYFRTTLTHILVATLKDDIATELSQKGFFKTPQGNNINSQPLKVRKAYLDTNVTLTYRVDLSTGKGGNVKKFETKVERANETMTKLLEGVKNGDDVQKFIDEEIPRWNNRIQFFINELNTGVKRDVIRTLTNREHLDDVVNINIDNLEDSETKVVNDFNQEVGAIDIEIEELNNKIKLLETEKSNHYITLAQELFKEKFKELPTDIKEEINTLHNTGAAFKKIKVGIFG